MRPFNLPNQVPKKINFAGEVQISLPVYILGSHAEETYRVLVELLQLPVEDFVVWNYGAPVPKGTTKLLVQTTSELGSNDLPKNAEAYRIVVSDEGGTCQMTVLAHDMRGLRYGLIGLVSNFRIDRRRVRTGEEINWPDFPIRGIVEGFYGEPWSHQERKSMIEFLSRFRLNTYMYAPKDDLYHRQKWREHYPPDLADQLRELASLAQANGVDFIYAIAPGLTIQYSSGTEVETLLSKISSVARLGVRNFALLLDDITERFLFEEDAKRFADFAEAHAFIVNQVWNHVKGLSPDANLYLCPTEYCQTFSQIVAPDYMARLGTLISSDVKLIWTGPQVCSETITEEDALYVKRAFRRTESYKPYVYWDNYPVNDARMYKELHIGPYEGRSPKLMDHCLGFLSNPMSMVEASKIAIACLADFTWNAENYDPMVSWDHALKQAVGQTAGRFLKFLGEICLLSPLRPNAATPLHEIDATDGEKLRAFIEEARLCAQYLASYAPNRNLIREIRPWLADLHYWTLILEAAMSGESAKVAELVNDAPDDVETIGRDVRALLPNLMGK